MSSATLSSKLSSAAYEKLLFSDWTQLTMKGTLEIPSLPPDLKDTDVSTLSGQYILQVKDSANISEPSRFRKLDNRENKRTRTLKLCLTDGKQVVFALELEKCQCLVSPLPTGLKVAVRGTLSTYKRKKERKKEGIAWSGVVWRGNGPGEGEVIEGKNAISFVLILMLHLRSPPSLPSYSLAALPQLLHPWDARPCDQAWPVAPPTE